MNMTHTQPKSWFIGLVLAALGFFALQSPAAATGGIPVQRGAYDTAGTANSIAVSGNYAYVADGADGLIILDISTPSIPTLVGSYDTPGDAKAVALMGTNAVVADGTGGVQIVNVATPSAPTFVAKYGTATTTASSVVASGTTAYAYIQDTFAGNGVVILDLTTPASPTLKATIPLTPSGRVLVSGTTLYIPTNAGFSIYDVTTPTAPVLTGSYAGSDLNGIFVNGMAAYLAGFTASFSVVDISTPSAPMLETNYYAAFHGLLNEAVTGSSNRLFIVQGSGGPTDNTLLTFDTTDATTPLAPVLLNSFALANKPNDLTLAGNLLYIPVGASGIQILDVGSVGVPQVSAVTLTKNVFKEKRSTGTVTFRPFNASYTGKIFARKINFGTTRGYVYLFAATDQFQQGTIALYSSKGKEIKRIKVGGRFFTNGATVDLTVETLNNHVYLAFGEKTKGKMVNAYDVTMTGLTRALNASAVKGKVKNGNVLVKFLAAYTGQQGLVSIIQGRPSTAKMWKLSAATNMFTQDTSFDFKKVKISGTNITLK